MNFIYGFDLLGTFAFALSGAMLGVKKEMDIYGLFVLALAVAVGGGTVRDIMLGSIPPFVLRDPNYLYVTVAAVVIVAIINYGMDKGMQYILLMDAIGLGVFTVIGASKAINAGLDWYGVVLCAILTSTGGGMIRDVLAREIPLVLRQEVYASASMLGGFLFLFLHKFSLDDSIAAFVTAVLVTGLRLVTLKKNYNLPKLLGKKRLI